MTLTIHGLHAESRFSAVELDSFPVTAEVARMVMMYSVAVAEGSVSPPRHIDHPEAVEQTLAVADYRRDRALARSGFIMRGDCPLPIVDLPWYVHVVETTRDLPEGPNGDRYVPDPDMPDPDIDTAQTFIYEPENNRIAAAEAWLQMRRARLGLVDRVEFGPQQLAVVGTAFGYIASQGIEPWERREAVQLARAHGVAELLPAWPKRAYNELTIVGEGVTDYARQRLLLIAQAWNGRRAAGEGTEPAAVQADAQLNTHLVAAGLKEAV